VTRAVQAVALAAVAGLLALLVWKVTHRPHTVAAALDKGEAPQAPNFTLRRLDDGRMLSLASLRGKPVVLDFWASWCWTCPRQSERLEAAMKRYRKYGVVALGVNTQDSSTRARRWLARYKITYPSVHDDGKVLRRWVGAVRLPSMFFVDRRGRVVGQMVVEEDLGRYLKRIARPS
jgi:cytochrome c biogenesis protein CcmG, thiol:disulfide interchange protein DsbE